MVCRKYTDSIQNHPNSEVVYREINDNLLLVKN